MGHARCVLAAAPGGAWVGKQRVRLLSAVLALDALALFVVPEFSAPRSVSVDTAPVAYLRSHIGNSRFFTLRPLAPNYGSYFGVSSLNINDLRHPPLRWLST